MATEAPQIENTNINTAEGVKLDDHKKTLVGCVLDLFAGRPSKAKLQLWDDNALFEDPLAYAQGRKEYEAQWYGLQSAFSEVERKSHEVTSSGNPIAMNLKNRYVVKGMNTEKIIDSVILISVNDAGKIEKVQDKWSGSLPDGAIANAFRRLNASTMPKVVGVPKED
ncbi:MAG: hypothetical protein M1831_005413 [Alyxoria varia]|nr:MAG: hypothetical protein M1831_005413 [Alyxoria varia]